MKPSSHPVTVLQNARHFSNTEVTIAHSRVVQGPSHYRYQHQEQESQPAQYYHGQHQHGHGGRQQVAPQQQQRHHRHQYHLDQVSAMLANRASIVVTLNSVADLPSKQAIEGRLNKSVTLRQS